MRSISKAFGPTLAVDGVDLDLLPGDIHGLVGENGAGKSTLMRVLSGFYADYAGEIVVDGRAVRILSPGQARALGIGLVHQELSLVPELTVADNIFLGREPPARLPGFIDLAASNVQARRLCAELGVHLHPDARVARLSIAERQLVEIAKGVALNPRVLILDEPTSSLTRQEINRLLDIVRSLAAKGMAIVYISHKLDEVFAANSKRHSMKGSRPPQVTCLESDCPLVGAAAGEE